MTIIRGWIHLGQLIENDQNKVEAATRQRPAPWNNSSHKELNMLSLDNTVVVEQAEWIIPFLSDLLRDSKLPAPLTLEHIQDWCDIDEGFAEAVAAALGCENVAWHLAGETVITKAKIKAALLSLGYDYDLEREKTRLTDLFKTYQGAVDQCGDEPRFRVCKAANSRLRDETVAQLEQLIADRLVGKGV